MVKSNIRNIILGVIGLTICLSNTCGALDSIDEFALKRTVKIVTESGGSITQGTGVHINPNFIVTNSHVVGTNSPMILYYKTSRFVRGYVVYNNPQADIAIVQVKRAMPFTSLNLGFTHGQKLLVVGNPFGKDFDVAETELFAYGPLHTPEGHIHNMVQFPCNGSGPGYSGGGLFDTDGKVVGIFKMSFPNIGLCAAIPPGYIKFVLDELKVR